MSASARVFFLFFFSFFLSQPACFVMYCFVVDVPLAPLPLLSFRFRYYYVFIFFLSSFLSFVVMIFFHWDTLYILYISLCFFNVLR